MPEKQMHMTVADQAHYVVPIFQPVPPGERPPGGFTQIFNRMIDRLLPRLSNAALKCYLALARNADPANGYTVSMGYGELVRITGLPRSSVQKGVAELLDTATCGCVVVVEKGGMVGSEHRPATYQMLMPVDPPKGAVLSTPIPPVNYRGVPPERYTPVPAARYTSVPEERYTPVPPERPTCTVQPVGISYNSKKNHTTKAADAAVDEALRELGIGGKNFERLSESCILSQVQKAKRALLVEQARGEEIENPAGWVISYLDGEIPPRVNTREAKDRAADRDRRQALMATKADYVKCVEDFIATVDEDAFTAAVCEIVGTPGYTEETRDHFLRTPTRVNFQLCEKVHSRLSKTKSAT